MHARLGAPEGGGKTSAAGKAVKFQKEGESLAVLAQLSLRILTSHDGGGGVDLQVASAKAITKERESEFSYLSTLVLIAVTQLLRRVSLRVIKAPPALWFSYIPRQ